ncbi:MAG: hypothetical protein K0S76_44 [Herbinix sp.]|jgi:hypothetical protein|nr:hypothetical protein [Herbinix sp.]
MKNDISYSKKIMLRGFMAMMMAFVFYGMIDISVANAATAITVATVDYEDNNIIINNNGNTKILFATDTEAAKGNWDIVDADRNPDGSLAATTSIDISWLSPAAENIIKIKGIDHSTQSRVVIMERTRSFDVSIGYLNINNLSKSDTIASLLNIMTTAGTAEDPINYTDLEWKKGDEGKWKDIDELTVAQLEKYQIKGTYLVFRIKAVNDITVGANYPDGTKGNRASGEVKLKIAKKASPMVVGIDGEEFSADIKYGKEYRITLDKDNDGDLSDEKPTTWKKVTDRSVKSIPLAEIVNNGTDGTIESKVFKPVLIEIRSYATSKLAASKITEILLDKQRIVDGTVIEGEVPEEEKPEDENIFITYTGNKNLNVTIPSASATLPYEYCVVKPGDKFDLTRVSWTSITKSTEVKILASKAVDGGTLYIRQKERRSQQATKTTAAVAYALASTYETHLINYPSMPALTKQSLDFVKGYSGSITFNVKLNEADKKPFETKIKSIKIGTREVEFETQTAPDPKNSKIQILTVTLKESSLKTFSVTYNKALSIAFENGTVDKTSIKISILNPTPAYNLTASSGKGTAAGTTAITIASSLGTKNKWVYAITDAEVKDKVTQDKFSTGLAFESGKDITVTAGKYITVYEINESEYIVKYRSILITADKIK